METETGYDLHQLIRKAEIESVKPWFDRSAKVLEIGGGSGYQAGIMTSWGCAVDSIDIAGRRVPDTIYHDVQDYDGKHIPFADGSFDRVFSSCVLEHVSRLDLPFLMQETRRVLKKEGLAIHILPTPSWRFWTSMEYYYHALRYALGWLRGSAKMLPGSPRDSSVQQAVQNHGILYVLNRGLFSPPHGSYPNGLLEVIYYSKAHWMRLFSNNGLAVIKTFGSGLFRVGSDSLVRYSLEKSRHFAKYLGSESRIFIVSPSKGR